VVRTGVLVVVQVVAVQMTALAEVVLLNRAVGIEGVLEQLDVQGKQCDSSFINTSIM
jgi:hypothetical protein